MLICHQNSKWGVSFFRGDFRVIREPDRIPSLHLDSTDIARLLCRVQVGEMLVVKLTEEETTCIICYNKFSSDIESKDNAVRRRLPVLSSSRCDHWCDLGGDHQQSSRALA